MKIPIGFAGKTTCQPTGPDRNTSVTVSSPQPALQAPDLHVDAPGTFSLPHFMQGFSQLSCSNHQSGIPAGYPTAFQLVNDVGTYGLSQQPPAHDPRRSFSGFLFRPRLHRLTDARLSPERHIPTDLFFSFGKLIFNAYKGSKTWGLLSMFLML